MDIIRLHQKWRGRWGKVVKAWLSSTAQPSTDLNGVNKLLRPMRGDYTICTSPGAMLSMTGYILDLEVYLNKLKTIEITSSIHLGEEN